MTPHALKQQTQALARLSDRALKLQASIDRKRASAFAALPSQFGYPGMGDFIKALRAACKPDKQVRRRKASRRPVPPALAPAVQAEIPPQSSISVASPAPLPAGDSLDDPKNFTLLPDVSLLDPNGKDPGAFRAALSERLRYADKVLATSRVPARIWREWRQFERQSRVLLQS